MNVLIMGLFRKSRTLSAKFPAWFRHELYLLRPYFVTLFCELIGKVIELGDKGQFDYFINPIKATLYQQDRKTCPWGLENVIIINS